jgi:GNAT superfamily N-acetyltransferase
MPTHRLNLPGPDEIVFADIVERPDLQTKIDQLIADNLPEFMMWASPGNWRWHRIYEKFPSDQIAALDVLGNLVGAINSIPLEWGRPGDLLPEGYDDVLVQATDHPAKRICLSNCLLSVSVRDDLRGRGIAGLLIQEMKQRIKKIGRVALVAPLRLTRKAEYPLVPIESFITWKNSAGEVFDPWLRTHLKLGAEIIGIADRSLVISQPSSRWGVLLHQSMSSPASYLVPRALVPVIVDEKGIGVYVEPNVWVYHRITDAVKEAE